MPPIERLNKAQMENDTRRRNLTLPYLVNFAKTNLHARSYMLSRSYSSPRQHHWIVWKGIRLGLGFRSARSLGSSHATGNQLFFFWALPGTSFDSSHSHCFFFFSYLKNWCDQHLSGDIYILYADKKRGRRGGASQQWCPRAPACRVDKVTGTVHTRHRAMCRLALLLHRFGYAYATQHSSPRRSSCSSPGARTCPAYGHEHIPFFYCT
jgi:hypothetical protein